MFDLAGADLPAELIERKLAGLQGLQVVFGPEGAPQPAVSVIVRQENAFVKPTSNASTWRRAWLPFSGMKRTAS